jgi:hypothetical protein
VFLSKKYNKRCDSILDIITSGGQVKEIYSKVISCLKKQDIDNSLIYLHLLVILTKRVEIEDMINFDQLIMLLGQQDLNDDDQLFVLRCLLELGQENQIYQNAINSCLIYMNHGCQDETSYNSFESLYHQV